VHDDDRTVPRELHVELDHPGAERLGTTERRERVLRARPARAPVGDHEEPHGLRIGAPPGGVKRGG
jgi:hypothetical protein